MSRYVLFEFRETEIHFGGNCYADIRRNSFVASQYSLECRGFRQEIAFDAFQIGTFELGETAEKARKLICLHSPIEEENIHLGEVLQ